MYKRAYYVPFAIFKSTILFKTYDASIVLQPFLNPCCASDFTLLSSDYLCNLLRIREESFARQLSRVCPCSSVDPFYLLFLKSAQLYSIYNLKDNNHYQISNYITHSTLVKGQHICTEHHLVDYVVIAARFFIVQRFGRIDDLFAGYWFV